MMFFLSVTDTPFDDGSQSKLASQTRFEAAAASEPPVGDKENSPPQASPSPPKAVPSPKPKRTTPVDYSGGDFLSKAKGQMVGSIPHVFCACYVSTRE